ncbi:non-ribosomal peptide synthetase [Kocuria sp. KH4]
MTTTSGPVRRAVPPPAPDPDGARPAPPESVPTRIPRWTQDPRAGQEQVEVAVPEDLRAAVPRLARAWAVAPEALWLAAHARVLQALSGEPEVTTGSADAAGTRALRLDPDGTSWQGLVREAHARHAPARAPRTGPDRDRAAAPGYEVVFDTRQDADPELPEGVVLGISRRGGTGDEVLRVRYRRDVLDAGAARRIAGYHLTALRHLLSSPGADPGDADLVGPDERRLQLERLAGPVRTRPGRRFHELFEESVRRHPGRTAAVQDTRGWTYGELNARANRVARALLARGMQAEDVVAVVAERNLEWLAAVIGILKAGGAYLPLEPRFPADRIARTLTRAGCRTVLTEKGSTGSLEEALADMPAVATLLVEDVEEQGHADHDLGVAVRGDQLAYVYFTSGSTGEPKGAMCEHDGMLNHLYAKIEDLGIGPGDVVAQTAPQCFDISLWQLVSALLVGGRTLLVGQDRILDVERFVDTVDQGGVTVLQLVPSYLDAVVAYLERNPRALPGLRCVSATGEALKQELVRRWFEVLPGVTLVNAYGLTETSDDTNHEVMRAAPADGHVPLGRPIANVRVHLLDERQRLVPLGAPGEIAFSGVCVGRGYINDPERTAQAYSTDPYVPGARLYRAGDYGRWSPDGKLEYLGRRDHQVKISGFRIEIGEIENALLRVPGVRDGAVVVAERADRGKHLVAFYQAPGPLDAGALREHLARSLPGYMVPQVVQWQPGLPLTANGKIDRKRLTALAAELETEPEGGSRDAPRTPTERWLAAAWSRVLAVPEERIDRRDHFFDLGGSSLTAVRLAIALDRKVSLKDLVSHPVLTDLATELDSRSAAADAPARP